MSEEQVEPCKHEHWIIHDTDLMGYGRCLDCNKAVLLSHLFNSLHDRMEEALKKLRE